MRLTLKTIGILFLISPATALAAPFSFGNGPKKLGTGISARSSKTSPVQWPKANGILSNISDLEISRGLAKRDDVIKISYPEGGQIKSAKIHSPSWNATDMEVTEFKPSTDGILTLGLKWKEAAFRNKIEGHESQDVKAKYTFIPESHEKYAKSIRSLRETEINTQFEDGTSQVVKLELRNRLPANSDGSFSQNVIVNWIVNGESGVHEKNFTIKVDNNTPISDVRIRNGDIDLITSTGKVYSGEVPKSADVAKDQNLEVTSWLSHGRTRFAEYKLTPIENKIPIENYGTDAKTAVSANGETSFALPDDSGGGSQ